MEKKQEDLQQEQQEETTATATEPGTQTNQTTDNAEDYDIMQLLSAVAESQELNTRFLRLQADFENFKRRTKTEKEELQLYANFDLLQKLLPVLDNFSRALQSKEDQGEKILQGVTMIYRQLIEILTKEGLTEINCIGEQFNPNLHEAVMQEASDEYEDNTIMLELQKGYTFREKLLRPAMVKVCKRQ